MLNLNRMFQRMQLHVLNAFGYMRRALHNFLVCCTLLREDLCGRQLSPAARLCCAQATGQGFSSHLTPSSAPVSYSANQHESVSSQWRQPWAFFQWRGLRSGMSSHPDDVSREHRSRASASIADAAASDSGSYVSSSSSSLGDVQVNTTSAISSSSTGGGGGSSGTGSGPKKTMKLKAPDIGTLWGLLILGIAYVHHSTTGFALPALLPLINEDLQLSDSQGALLTTGYTVRS